MTGASGFRLLVGSDGSVKDCVISSSSGSPVLDATACALLKARASFAPGRDATGKKVESIFSSRVSWVLPAGFPINLPEPRSLTVLVDVSKEGVVEKCTVEKSVDFTTPSDPCVQYPVGRKGASFIGKDGKPIAVRFVNRMTNEVQAR